jgi:hypothetical protein
MSCALAKPNAHTAIAVKIIFFILMFVKIDLSKNKHTRQENKLFYMLLLTLLLTKKASQWEAFILFK